MAIQELEKNKKYLIRVAYRDGKGNPRDRKRTVYGTKRDALLEEQKLIDELTIGITRDMTFNDLFVAYHNSKPNILDDSKRKEIEVFERFLNPISNLKIENITPYNLILLRNNIQSDKGSITQKNKAIYLMKSIYKFGKKAFGINNLASDIEIIRPKVKDTFKYNTLTPSEFNDVIRHEKLDVYRLLYEIYFWAGLRRGEALALYKKDLLPSKELDIYNSINSYQQIGPLKNESSYRRVKIHDELYNKLLPYASSQGLFLLGNDTNLAPNTVNRRFTNCLKKENSDRIKKNIQELPHIRIHDLRHSHATFLASQNLPVTVVSSRLGHGSLTETMSTYIHLFKGDDDRAISAIDKYMDKDDNKGIPIILSDNLKSNITTIIKGNSIQDIETVFKEILNEIKNETFI